MAVQRSFARQGGERQTDFINCAAWRQQADFIAKYFGKGRMICITGNLRTRTYDDKNGTKHYVTEIYVDSAGTYEKCIIDLIEVNQKVEESGRANLVKSRTAISGALTEIDDLLQKINKIPIERDELVGTYSQEPVMNLDMYDDLDMKDKIGRFLLGRLWLLIQRQE